jgi:alcohol dehydrogenase class IV
MKCIEENKLARFLKKKKIQNILLVTGKKSFYNSGFKNLEIFKKYNFNITIFFKNNLIPEIKELELLIKKINIVNPDLIIALGGGSVIDYAKLANVLHNIKKLKIKIKSNKIDINSRKTEILAIPTTAGSGAEVTKFSVIYISKLKYSIEHNFIQPNFYSLIPKLVVKSPKIIRASSAFDAIAQASESIFSKKANIHSLKYSAKSLHYSIKNFLYFVNKPNLTNAKSMLMAANFSGKAINIAKTNAPHALSYFFTSRFRIPHGISVSIFFIELISLYYFIAYKKNNLVLIKKFKFFLKLIKKKDILEFIDLFNKFLQESGINIYLKKFYNKITKIDNIKSFYYNSQRLKNSPIFLSKSLIRNLYSKKINQFIKLYSK